MSGGSMDYFYARMQDYAHELHDIELDEMMDDLCDLYYAREWYDSGDTDESDWLEALKEFKTKWLGMSTKKRTDRIVDKIRKELEKSLGTYTPCGECANWEAEENSEKYGICPYHEGCLTRRKSVACEKFVDRCEDR